MKKASIQVQKCAIKVDSPTMLTSTPSERIDQDAEMRHEIKEGQTLSLHVPEK